MKKIISMVLLLAIFCSMASCGKGTSIAIQAVRLDNQVENLFVWDKEVQSLTEKNVYKDKDGNDMFTSEYYYEDAADIYSMYNIRETIGDYTLYAYEGSVYTETEKGITAVILFSSTYTEFISSYLNGAFPLDGDVLNQKRSEKDGDQIVAYYHSKLTPQQTAKVQSFGIDGTETVETRYVITDGNFISSIDYTVIEKDSSRLVAQRFFEKKNEKQAGVFDSVSSLTKSVSVNFIFVGKEQEGRHFEIPAGVYLGIDTADYEYEFFYDEACTLPYEYDKQIVSENITLYVRAKA
ncbi:MAG: hypothetical protein E7603_06310 [Ruminococcaceae bacterium]|nr:hypothetical protein [Oscillospiraceae bacterium]